MTLSASAGRKAKHDAFVEVRGFHGSGDSRMPAAVSVTIESPVRDLFGPAQDRAVESVLAELGVNAGEVHVVDQHALDFVLRARVRAAVARLRAKGGRI